MFRGLPRNIARVHVDEETVTRHRDQLMFALAYLDAIVLLSEFRHEWLALEWLVWSPNLPKLGENELPPIYQIAITTADGVAWNPVPIEARFVRAA